MKKLKRKCINHEKLGRKNQTQQVSRSTRYVRVGNNAITPHQLKGFNFIKSYKLTRPWVPWRRKLSYLVEGKVPIRIHSLNPLNPTDNPTEELNFKRSHPTRPPPIYISFANFLHLSSGENSLITTPGAPPQVNQPPE